MLRVVAERADSVLLVAYGGLDAALGLRKRSSPHSWVCFGWVPRGHVEPLA